MQQRKMPYISGSFGGAGHCTAQPEGHTILGREKYSTLCIIPGKEEMYYIAMMYMAYRTFLVDKKCCTLLAVFGREMLHTLYCLLEKNADHGSTCLGQRTNAANIFCNQAIRMFIQGVLFPTGLNAVHDVLFRVEGTAVHGALFLVR